MTIAYAVFTMLAFAGNSLLCRAALGGHLIDPISFTTVRLASGAVVLMLLAKATGTVSSRKAGSWASGAALFAYAIAFSLAYVSLSAGTGALILFGAVQITMIGAAIRSKESLTSIQWIGLAIAVLGLVYLVLPGIAAPNPVGALLMLLAGAAWGIYSIRGRGAPAPIAMTAGNFLYAAPFAIGLSVASFATARASAAGIVLALISGIVTSGLGYSLWYMALRGLSTVQASVIQLTVPMIAAFGGVLLLSEHISLRLLVASIAILSGVALAVIRRRRKPPKLRFASA